MAECIIIHFKIGTSKRALELLFDKIAKKYSNAWTFPKHSDFNITIYEYLDFESEYEEVEKREVGNKLDGKPDVSYCFELRRSRQTEACHSTQEIIVSELASFQFVVDDCHDYVWLKEEILKSSKFLKNYRCVKHHNG